MKNFLFLLSLLNTVQIFCSDNLSGNKRKLDEISSLEQDAQEPASKKAKTEQVNVELEQKVSREQANAMLIEAVKSGDFKQVELAIHFGADVNVEFEAYIHASKLTFTPLLYSIYENMNDIPFLLIKHSANIHYVVNNKSALDWALSNHRIDIAKALKDLGAKRYCTPTQAHSALYDIMSHEDNRLYDTEKVVTKGISASSSKQELNDYLIASTRIGSIAGIEKALQLGADINANDGDYCSLHYAIENNDLKTVSVLLNNGADVHACDSEGDPALIIAVNVYNKTSNDIVESLLKAGADPNAQDEAGASALEACYNADHIKLLLKYNANPNIEGAYGPSPLFKYVEEDIYTDCLTALIEGGADIHQKNERGDTICTICLWRHINISNLSSYSLTDEIFAFLKSMIKLGTDLHAQGYYKSAFEFALEVFQKLQGSTNLSENEKLYLSLCTMIINASEYSKKYHEDKQNGFKIFNAKEDIIEQGLNQYLLEDLTNIILDYNNVDTSFSGWLQTVHNIDIDDVLAGKHLVNGSVNSQEYADTVLKDVKQMETL